MHVLEVATISSPHVIPAQAGIQCLSECVGNRSIGSTHERPSTPIGMPFIKPLKPKLFLFPTDYIFPLTRDEFNDSEFQSGRPSC